MYSSLPSAGKLYGSSTSRAKQKSNVPNSKRKRKKSKVQAQISVSENVVDTLIGTSKTKHTSMDNCNYDSDTSEPTSCVVRFCMAEVINDVQNIQPISSQKINEASEVDDVELCHEQILDTSNTKEEFEQSGSSMLKEEINGNGTKIIVTSAEIHYDTSLDNNDEENCNFESSLDDVVPIKHQAPIIIISSADSISQSIDLEDNLISESIVQTCDDRPIEVCDDEQDHLPDRFCVQPKFSPYETIDEGDEYDESFDSVSKLADDMPCTSNDILQKDEKTEENLFCDPNIISENSSNKNEPTENEKDDFYDDDDDNESVRSDCCPSKNIYNDYFTDAIDETDDNFMIDDSKSCTSSTTPSDSDHGESESHRNNVIDCSHSSSKQCISDSPSVKTAVASDTGSSSHCRQMRRMKALKLAQNERARSLPNFMELESCNLPNKLCGNNDSQITQFASNISVTSFHDRTVQTSFRKMSVSDEIPKCLSSSSTLSTGSCSFSGILPPVSVHEARLRSYVVGSIKATGSLLGIEELTRYFPDKKINVFIGTWNMNGQNPPDSLDDFLLPLSVPQLSDIYAVGVQEGSQSSMEWDILMQTTIGPSHVLFASTSLGVLHLAVFVRRDLVWFCSEPEEANVSTRPGSMVKTKGAVAICFLLFGTSFLFLNSHLTAHERKLKERVCDYEKICSLIDLPKKFPLKPQYQSKDVTSRFDNVFWCGDLNFRVVQDRPSVLSFVEEKLAQTMHTCDFLLKHDQLHKAMSDGVAFHGFEEGKIDFVPSYKFDVGSHFFNSTKQRVPSYTDRVLFRCKKAGSARCTLYNVVSSILTSDHKPVFAVFEVEIRPGRDNIPLAAGHFKRGVYIEANKRRAMALEVKSCHKTSTICSIM